MTFKHTNFDDSATMRSLIKVAAEKGWVKQEPIQKTASVSEDLSPSDNLTENVIKLCSGLRNSGLDKFADELEVKFLTYKQANSLYGVHKEEGKDLIDAAHPKGGHKMEDLPDAVIGTILENRLKILNVVNKKPTGKLASHLDIMKAVKVALGGDPSKITAKLNKVLSNVNTIFSLHEQENLISRPLVQGKDTLRELINSAIQNANNPDVLEGLCFQIKAGLDSFYSAFKPGWAFGGSSKEIWGNMEPVFASAYAALASAQKLLEEPDIAPAPVVVKKPLEDLLNQVNAVKNKVQSWKSIGPIVKQPTAIKWINIELSNLEDIINRYTAAPEDQHGNLVNALSKELNAELKDINQFEKDWITG
jgi:hypothetical protein